MESVLSVITEFPCIIKGAESGPLISRSRNLLLEHFLETDADYFLAADTDTVFNASDVRYLLEARKPIVGALYYGILGHNPNSTFPVALTKQNGVLQSLDKAPKRLTRVDALGMGLTLIRRDVIEKLGANSLKNHPFAETIWCDKHGAVCPQEAGEAFGEPTSCPTARHHGEDAVFCLKANKAGFSSWLEPKARIGHCKTVVL